MSLTGKTQAANYMAMPIKNPSKEGIRVISAMSTPRILGYVSYRHRVGLLGLTSLLMLAYIAYDKAIRYFL